MEPKEIEEQALSLSWHQRLELAEKLLASLKQLPETKGRVDEPSLPLVEDGLLDGLDNFKSEFGPAPSKRTVGLPEELHPELAAPEKVSSANEIKLEGTIADSFQKLREALKQELKTEE